MPTAKTNQGWKVSKICCETCFSSTAWAQNNGLDETNHPFFFFILIFFWWCIRLPVSCVVLWGKLSGSFVALPPFQALKVTAFLSRVCKKKCIYLSMCQHTQLPTYQTCSFIAQLCNIVCIRFRFELYSHMDWSNHVAWGLIQTRKMSYYFISTFHSC